MLASTGVTSVTRLDRPRNHSQKRSSAVLSLLYSYVFSLSLYIPEFLDIKEDYLVIDVYILGPHCSCSTEL